MAASPIASVRVFEPVRDADVGSLRSVRSQRRRRYREIIMLNNLLLAPHHHQVRRSHRSIYCWHGHAAAPYRASGFVQWRKADVVWTRLLLIDVRRAPKHEMTEGRGDRLGRIVLPGLCLESDDAPARLDDRRLGIAVQRAARAQVVDREADRLGQRQ